MSPNQEYGSLDLEYQVQSRQERTPKKHQSRSGNRSRRQSSPSSFNGIHRRKKKKIRW